MSKSTRRANIAYGALAIVLALAALSVSLRQSTDETDASPPEPSLAQQAQAVRAGQSNEVRLEQTLVRDSDLRLLEDLESKLERVNFSRTEITDAGFERLCRLKDLEQLRLSSPLVTNQGLAGLKDLKRLRFLHLLDMPITDAGLDQLHALATLESLYLDNTKATDEGIGRLLKALPDVHLHVDDHHPGHAQDQAIVVDREKPEVVERSRERSWLRTVHDAIFRALF